MLSSDFDYELPESAIAQQALEKRELCKLAAVERATGDVRHLRFDEIGSCLRRGDLLVLNDSRVVPARIPVRRVSGGAVEIFLLDPAAAGDEHEAFLKPAHKLKTGEWLLPEREPASGNFELLGNDGEGVFRLRWRGAEKFSAALLERLGVTPLPPYIQRERVPAPEQAARDRESYQTVYAAEAGSVAAPTAGLHFSTELLAQLAAEGIETARVTLHVGAGTFLPVKTETLEEHPMHEEFYNISPGAWTKIQACRAGGGRVIAVGTTALRSLESAARLPDYRPGQWQATRLFLKPGDPFLLTDGLLTNFHQPRSTLLPLICAFWNRDDVLRLYHQALDRGYRFLSFGDACLFL